MRYEGMVIRPPSEANSYILQVTYGCSHNRCTFCGTYMDKPFQVRPMQEVLEDVALARAEIPDTQCVFLADGNALVLGTLTVGKTACKLIAVGGTGSAVGIIRHGVPPQLASLEEVRPMFRQVWTIALVVMATLGSLAVATAQESKEAGGKKQIPPKELAVDLGKGFKLELVLIPAGEFMMGSPDSDKESAGQEKPQHRVRISKPFYMGKYLVTQEQWEAVMGSNPSLFKGPKNPVEQVSWDDCQVFLGKLNENSGGGRGNFHLPTEAQWEYACRAGSTARYYFGDKESGLGEYAWYGKNSGGQSHPVGEKKPNAWGLYDMHGNVWEWCHDWHDSRYYANAPMDDPRGPAAGSNRVLRGGSFNPGPAWADWAWYCRSASRNSDEPGLRSGVLGLRVCLVPADK